LSPGRLCLLGLAFAIAACRGELRFDEAYRECTADRPCPLASLHCHAPSGTCVPCLDDEDCSGSRPFCDPGLHRCVECPGQGSCQGQGQRLCDVGTHRCLVSCDDGRCRDGSNGHCTSSHGLCRACEADQDCTGARAGPLCHTGIGRCVQCFGDGDCAAPTRRCDQVEGRCVGCVAGADCDLSQVCDPATHTCRAP
jgi:hypothetical protein